jgi:hypothetical protein
MVLAREYWMVLELIKVQSIVAHAPTILHNSNDETAYRHMADHENCNILKECVCFSYLLPL